jgi:hypothetical protein
MGTSTDALLCYGYDIGGAERWKFTEADDGQLPSLGWYDDDGDDVITAAEEHLVHVIGNLHPGDSWRSEGYYDRRSVAEERVGVTFVTHCSQEYPLYVMVAAASVTRARRGDVEVIDAPELVQPSTLRHYDEQLAAACDALGLHPPVEPQWLLVSWWG